MVRKFLSCKVQIRNAEEDRPIYFKNDGNRFKYPWTLKMVENSTLQFIVHCRPLNGSPITQIEVDGIKMSLTTLPDQLDGDVKVSFPWKSSKPQTTNKRSWVRMEFAFGELYLVQFELQVKYYKNKKSKHLTWGRKLNYLQVEACIRDLDLYRLSPFYLYAH